VTPPEVDFQDKGQISKSGSCPGKGNSKNYISHISPLSQSASDMDVLGTYALGDKINNPPVPLFPNRRCASSGSRDFDGSQY